MWLVKFDVWLPFSDVQAFSGRLHIRSHIISVHLPYLSRVRIQMPLWAYALWNLPSVSQAKSKLGREHGWDLLVFGRDMAHVRGRALWIRQRRALRKPRQYVRAAAPVPRNSVRHQRQMYDFGHLYEIDITRMSETRTEESSRLCQLTPRIGDIIWHMLIDSLGMAG